METPRPSLFRFAQRALIFVAVAVLVVGLTWILCKLSQVLLFVFAGLLFALLLHGVADFVTRKTGLWKHVALGLLVAFFLGLTGTACWFIGPRLTAELQGLTEAVPKGLAQAQEQFQNSWIGPPHCKSSASPGDDACS